MNNLQVFKNEMFEVSIQMENGEILFDAENVAKSLGLTETKNKKEYVMWRRVNLYLKPFGTTAEEENSPQVAKGDFIPESLVYKLAFKANNEVAEDFQDWLAIEVLPSIRKHGAYLTDSKIEEVLMDPDTIIKLATQLKEERLQRQVLENKVIEDKPKVLFAEAVENSEDVILVKEMATIITQNGFKIGQNELFQYLRDKEFLCKRLGDMYHLPTKRYEHFFKVTKRTIQNSKRTIIKNTPKVTGKGQMYFMEKFEVYKNEGLTIKDLLTKESA